jgi:hypothetical protein
MHQSLIYKLGYKGTTKKAIVQGFLQKSVSEYKKDTRMTKKKRLV